MAKKIVAAVVKSGMNKDSNTFNSEAEYTHAKNCNLENESGEFLNIRNEKSNILASKFKEGFKVIHQQNDIDTDRTYFFLVNPSNGVGEFGYIEDNQNTNDLTDLTVNCDDCHQIKELADPLETITQQELQTYVTLISDACHVLADPPAPEKGFMFDILNPIKKSVIKNEKCGKTIYFSHVGNPPRHINIDNIDQYFTQVVPCDDDVTLDCPDFDMMRVFKLFNIPKLVPTSIDLGGNLKMGVYEFLIAYCDAEGNEISEYYSLTSPISIFDKNNQIQGQPTTADRTNFLIRLEVEGLDINYNHYKIAVIQTADIDGATSYFIEGVHTIDDISVVYATEQNKVRTSIDNLARVLLKVEEAEGVATANNILYQYGITNKKELNLQPVVNLIGELAVKWQTHIASESLYDNGVAISKYLGYNRDEIVPIGIKFLLDGGFETSLFPFIGRVATDEDKEDVVDIFGEAIDGNKDVASILANKGDCSSVSRIKKWQYYNTATVDEDFCPGSDVETVEVEETVTKVCIVEDIATIPAGSVSIATNTVFTSLEEYVNDEKGTTEAECDEAFIATSGGNICDYLYDDYSAVVCETDLFAGLDCATPTIEEEVIEIQKVLAEETSLSYVLGREYEIKTIIDAANLTAAGASATPIVGEVFVCTAAIVITVGNVVLKEGENVERIPKDFAADYNRIVPLTTCIMHEVDTDTNTSKIDPDFATSYVNVSNTAGMVGAYLRYGDFNDEDCGYATFISESLNPSINTGLARFNNYKFTEDGTSDLLSTEDVFGANYVETLNFVSGTLGSVMVTINATPFITPFAVDIATTANNFFAAHEAAIEALTGGTLTKVGNIITLASATLFYIDGVTLTGDLNVQYSSVGFTNKLHKGALWFRGVLENRVEFILDISKHLAKTPKDWVATRTQTVRLSVFKSCSASSAIFSEFVDMASGGMFLFTKSGSDLIITDAIGVPYSTITNGWFSSGEYFITIDNSITGKTIDTVGAVYEPRWTTTPNKGCYTVTSRRVEDKRVDITWDSITLRKGIKLKATCTFNQPVVQSCRAVPYKKGGFAYWESQETYPDNPELFDSSSLLIEEADIPDSVKEKFEEVFADPNVDGEYVWKLDEDDKEVVDFTCRPIRHFKFPDNKKAPFIYDNPQSTFADSIIFPLGITVDEEVINAFLDIAENNNLISQKDRESITSYEIVRGNSEFDRSVVASGLLYDMRTYQEDGEDILYPNYPYNSYSADKMNNIEEAGFGDGNINYTFHSPETDYFRPSLPTEMSIQGYMYGRSKGYVDEVIDHPGWVILTDKARDLAGVLAGLEVTAEALIRSAQTLAGTNGAYFTFAGIAGVGFNAGGIGTSIAAYVADGLASVSKAITDYGRYRYQWLKIFTDLGTPYNFASYYYSEGKYNFLQLEQEEGESVRGLNIAKYLKEGMYETTNEVIADNISINNIMREKSVYLSTGDFPITYPSTGYKNYDTESLTYLGENGLSQAGKSSPLLKNIASPYVAVKNFLPQQYGTINSVRWLTTGYRGDLTNPRTDCLSIFGGDTFISRHTLKRKHAQFLVNSMGQADRTPFNYFFYNNIGRNPLFYVSYNVDKDFESSGKIFPDITDEFVLDNETKGGNYYRPPSKFYLFYYGIPSFLCETRINTNFRYAEAPYERQFYPQVGDLGDWTQEKNVSIRQPNHFFYNKTYSKQVTGLKNRLLPITYKKEDYDCKSDFPNGIVASLPDNSENNSYDPWLIYRPLDFFEFPTNLGKLKDVQGIENEAILTRFENTSILYNKVDYTNDDGQNPSEAFLGGTVFFQRRSASFYNAQLGFGGTQNTTSVSCEFGHFHVDAKRGQVIQMPSGGQQMEEISSMINGKPSGMRNWFKEHLPFKILKYFKDVDVDNHYNGIGITMAWDSRYRRVFITKKDFIPKNENIIHTNGHYFLGEEEVFLTDSTYFLDVSWTIAFSPILGTWMSFYDFKPNYYISHNNYFQSGVNQTEDESEFGLWSHGLTNKSYQVFYGKKYSFDVEYPVKAEYNVKRLNNVKLWTEAKRYHNEYDWAFTPMLTFNKSLIHNNVSCSGYLNLIPQKNNFVANKNYPKTNSDGTQDILITNKDNYQWGYDYFFNRVDSNVANIPFINYDKNQIEKTIDTNIVKFKGKRVLDRMEGEWFKNLVQYDVDSRFSLALRFTLNETDEV